MWQPKIIHKCKIKGFLPLFEAGPNRFSHNWAQYQNSTVPQHWSGGGGWSLQQLTLGAVYQENELLRNVWTKSNQNLPLCRFLGLKLKLYKTECTDYVCHYTTCSPMLDTVYHHAGAQPSRLLMQKQKIIVPKTTRNILKKPYIKKFIKPGDLFTNKWYFQHDIVNTPLVMLTTSACELDYYYISPWSVSHSISFYSINTTLFKHNQFKLVPTNGYSPKASYYLFATTNGDHEPKIKDLIYLGDTEQYYPGVPPTSSTLNTYTQKKEYWGNPFHAKYINEDVRLYVSNLQPNQVIKGTDINAKAENIAQLSTPLYVTCRYTPNQDTGKGNKVYLVSTVRETNFAEPNDSSLIFEDFPLWILLWGWFDWIQKLGTVHGLERDYQIVIKSNFITPQLDYYVLIDDLFLNGKSPYQTGEPPPTVEDQHYWYPQTKYQQVTIDQICMSGPATPKPKTKSIQAHAEYTLLFKWGGCPASMEPATNPATQPTYPLPDNIYKAYEIQDPGTSPQRYLYDFDERNQMLTKTAYERISKDSKSTKPLFTDPALGLCKFNPPPKTQTQEINQLYEALLQTPPEKEENQTLQQQLQYQWQQQQELKHKLLRLIQLQNTK